MNSSICRECGARTTVHCDRFDCPTLRSDQMYLCPAISEAPMTDTDRQIKLVRHIALTCLQAGRKKADFILGPSGPIGFQDWAELQFRKLAGRQPL